MSANILNFLSHIPPFNVLSPLELQNVAGMSREEHRQKGEAFYSEGDEAQYVWVLQLGRLEIFKYLIHGKSNAIECILPRGFFGTYCRLGSKNSIYPCTAVAAVDSTAIAIPNTIFWGLYERNGPFLSSVCALCSQRLVGMQSTISTAHEPVAKRIVKTMLTLIKEYGKVLPFTRREVAELSATTVESAIRTLSVFEKRRWITSKRNQIRINDLRNLKSVLDSKKTASPKT